MNESSRAGTGRIGWADSAGRRPGALLRGALLAPVLALLNPGAAAQDLNAYGGLRAALAQATAAATPAARLAALEQAQAAYGTLRPTIRSATLAQGLSSSLSAAQAAIARTPTDLQAQVLYARALMRKVLRDQTLGLPTIPATQAGALAGEFGLTGPARTAFVAQAAAGATGALARTLNAVAGRRMVSALAGVQAAPASAQARAASYLALTSASSWFTVVQDSGNTGTLSVQAFGQALGQLVGNDSAGLATSLTALRGGAAGFLKANSSAAPAAQVPATQPPTTRVPTPGAPVPQPPVSQPPVSQPPVSQPPVNQAPVNQAPASQQPASQPPSTQPPAAQALGTLYTQLGRALTAAGHGDAAGARNALTAAQSGLSGLAPALRNTADFPAFQAGVQAASVRSGLYASEVQALIAQLGGLEAGARAEPVNSLDRLSAGVSRVLVSPLRALLFLLLGLGVFYPLYLLNLAFGGRNAYWRAISVAIFVLFVPALLEGLGGLLGYLGDLLGVPALATASTLSPLQGGSGLPVWAVTLALALGLASYGFQGLCRQFGLLGGRSEVRPETQPALDWDEEL